MLDTSLRARSASEIVDAAFALYKQHALQLIVVTAIAMSPSIIYSILVSGVQPQTPEEILAYLPVMGVAIISQTLAGAVVARLASDFYLGQTADVATAVRAVVTRLFSILGALLMVFAITCVAAVFLLLPVFWVVALFYATIPIIVIERKGAFAAMSRSAKLSKGNKGHILGTLALVLGIFMVLSIGLSLTATAVGGPTLQIIISSLFAVVVGPVVNVALMVLYYDTRIRVDGFDVEHMAESLSTPAMTAPTGGSVA